MVRDLHLTLRQVGCLELHVLLVFVLLLEEGVASSGALVVGAEADVGVIEGGEVVRMILAMLLREASVR